MSDETQNDEATEAEEKSEDSKVDYVDPNSGRAIQPGSAFPGSPAGSTHDSVVEVQSAGDPVAVEAEDGKDDGEKKAPAKKAAAKKTADKPDDK